MPHDRDIPNEPSLWDVADLLAEQNALLHSLTERGYEPDEPTNHLRSGPGEEDRLWAINQDVVAERVEIPEDDPNTSRTQLYVGGADRVYFVLYSPADRLFEARLEILDESGTVLAPIDAGGSDVPGAGLDPRLEDSVVRWSSPVPTDYLRVRVEDRSGAASNRVKGVVYIS